MASHWEHIELKIHAPQDKNEEYRDTIRAALTSDQKLYFFGLKGVDPTSENFHESCLLGSFISIFDFKNKNWQLMELEALDNDESHREYIFTVGTHVFVFVYSQFGGYYKLFELLGGKWGPEIKFDSVCPDPKSGCCDKQDRNGNYKFYPCSDGFYCTWENSTAFVARFIVDLDPKGNFKSAKCICMAHFNMTKYFRHDSHITCLAFTPDHKQVFLWGGEQGCGFWWYPNKVFVANLELDKLVEAKPVSDIPNPTPPYAFSGPRDVLQVQDQLFMLGGSIQIGLGHVEDNHEIWVFDTKQQTFQKVQSLTMPRSLRLYRVATVFDHTTGDIYVCDKESGIYKNSLAKI